MERRNVDEKLSAPADFVTSDSRNKQGIEAAHNNLIPPSHFTSCPQTSTTVTMAGPAIGRGSPMTWGMPMQASPLGMENANPWLTIAQAKQEILELRKTNQRLMELRGNSSSVWTCGPHQEVTSKISSADRSDLPSNCWIDTEWKLETERMRGLEKSGRGLKEAIGRQRDDIVKRDHSLNRKSEELEELRAELCQTKTDLSDTKAELGQSRAEQEQLCVELEKLKNMEGERNRLEAQRTETELCQKETFEESCKLEILKLKEELLQTQRKHQAELEQLSVKHHTEVSALGQTNADLQDRLSYATEEIANLERRLQQVSEERDKLTEELSQVGKAYETQSTTLQRLRNYVGQLVPERQEEAKQSDMVQKLEKEKEALQVTAELLTIRLSSLVDILAIQEKEMGDTIRSDPLLKVGSKASQVLRCWREKVFVLLVQLRSKDIELRGERVKLLSTISTLEQEVKRLMNQASMFQHSLQDRIAELDLERVRRETAERELAQAMDKNERLKGLSQVTGSAMKTMTEAVQRFSLMFEDKVTEVQAAQRQLHRLNQRLTFAKGRVETIQGLVMRREALWKVQQASKLTDPASECQHTELALVCEERDNLVQELKRTPDLIEKALSEAHKRFESELKELKQSLLQSREKALKAEAGHSQALQKLQEAHTDMEEQTKSLEELRAELVNQEEQSERALREKVSETEARFVQQLKELESQLNTARREHTKAVLTLRQSERQAERDRERLREMHLLQDEQIQKEMQELQKQLQETDKDRNILLAIVHENGFLDQWKRARTTALYTSRALEAQHQSRTGGKAVHFESKVKPLTREMTSVLHDLQALSASVVNSSEISSEEDDNGETSGPSKETVEGPSQNNSKNK
ncbi:hypothetical protein ANANG_G00151360 [Anguilla anguilla]|uniref:Coiled-coil alpha-helical rod protein 1 n=1 Tax=Anguilla anguilla TaxID=7936 RepID=A0A9D3RUF6_ANGAN|nr:hypothetical protein ANANG_G00151360 [Anguilla anguilla]